MALQRDMPVPGNPEWKLTYHRISDIRVRADSSGIKMIVDSYPDEDARRNSTGPVKTGRVFVPFERTVITETETVVDDDGKEVEVEIDDTMPVEAEMERVDKDFTPGTLFNQAYQYLKTLPEWADSKDLL